jgi:hypothetical protein
LPLFVLNTYRMSRRFCVLVGPASSSMAVTTLLAALALPIALVLPRVKPS